MDLENGCRVCKRHRSFYGRIDGRCLVCRLSWRWSTDNRLRALAKSASSTVNNGFSEGALLHECIKDIVHQHLHGSARPICKAARRQMWRRILTGHFCTQPQADEDSDSSMGYDDSEDEREALMRRASRPCQNPFWKIMLVHRKELRRDANVIYLVIDFLGDGCFTASRIAPDAMPTSKRRRPKRTRPSPGSKSRVTFSVIK